MAKAQDFSSLYNIAHIAGLASAEQAKVVPMVVADCDILGRPIAGGRSYFVADGVCGFAWVAFKGNTPFGRWAKKAGLARSSYPSGMQISVSYFNQSLQLKEAYAEAFAKVLRENGVEAYANSRMD